MKQFIAFIALMLMIFSFQQTYSFSLETSEELSITQEVSDDLYSAWGRVDIQAPINGDLIIAGGEINIDSQVLEDVNIVGGDIDIKGVIWDDLRVLGWNIQIDSDVTGDVLIAWGDVRISKNVIIGWDLLVWAGRVVLDGEVLWKVTIGAEEFILNGVVHENAHLMIDQFKSPTGSGQILWDLKYESHQNISELESVAQGEVSFEQSFVKEDIKQWLIEFITSYLLLKVLGLFVLAAALFFFFEKYFMKVSQHLRESTAKSFLTGFLTVIVTPVLVILLFVSVIGIPVAFFLLFGYVFMFVFLSLINVIVLSSVLIQKYSITAVYQKILIILGLSLVFGIINGISIVAWFFTLGALFMKKYELIQELRK